MSTTTTARKKATPMIYQAMSEVMKKIGHIGKDQVADMGRAGRYKFRGIDDIYNAVQPCLTEFGVIVIPRCDRSEHDAIETIGYDGKAKTTWVASISMTYTFHAPDGSSLVAEGIPGVGFDKGDKAMPKALSEAYKYAVVQTFCIPTEGNPEPEQDNDPALPPVDETDPAELITKQKELLEALAAIESIEALDAWGKSLAKLPAALRNAIRPAFTKRRKELAA